MRNLQTIIPVLLATVCGFVHDATAQQRIQAPVLGVVDGDTIALMVNNHSLRVNLAGIDAPEVSQPFRMAAKEALLRMVRGAVVTVDVMGRDPLGGLVGEVRVGEVSINEEMVLQGWAWTTMNEGPLAVAQQAAQEERRGLWSTLGQFGPQPIPPWQWKPATLSRPWFF